MRIDWCFAGSAGFADLGAAEFFRDRAGTVADEGSLADDPPRLLQEFEMLPGRGGGVGVEMPAQVRHRIDDARAQIRGFKHSAPVSAPAITAAATAPLRPNCR